MRKDDPHKIYDNWKQIGKGSFGIVYLAYKGKTPYAVKVLEDNNNLILLRKEIAFQIKSDGYGPSLISLFLALWSITNICAFSTR